MELIQNSLLQPQTDSLDKGKSSHILHQNIIRPVFRPHINILLLWKLLSQDPTVQIVLSTTASLLLVWPIEQCLKHSSAFLTQSPYYCQTKTKNNKRNNSNNKKTLKKYSTPGTNSVLVKKRHQKHGNFCKKKKKKQKMFISKK